MPSRAEKYWIRVALFERQGGKCPKCKRKITRKTGGEIHHVDHNAGNWDYSNLQHLCRRCNRKDNQNEYANARERKKKTFASATERVRAAVDFQTGSAEMQASEHYEAPFRNWLIAWLRARSNAEIPYTDRKKTIINTGAETVGCSPTTSRKYVDKMVSEAATAPCREWKHPEWKTILITLKEEYRN